MKKSDHKKITKKMSKKRSLPIPKQPIEQIPQQLILDLLDLKLSGESGYMMRLYVLDQYPQFTEGMIDMAINQVYKDLNSMSQENIFDIVSKHIIRYEEIYKWFRERKLTKEANVVLAAKEKLMGLHSDNVEIEINNIFGETDEDNKQFNEFLLSSDELDRFHFLINKAST